MNIKLRSRSVNNGTELLPYLVSSRHRIAIDELMAQLNPTTGPITRVVSYLVRWSASRDLRSFGTV